MNAVEIAMLVCGLALFAAALGLLVFCVVKHRSVKPVLVLFPIAIIMIGFPSIKSFKLPGAEVSLREEIRQFAANPDSPAARSNLDRALDNSLAAGSPKPLTPEVHSNLVAAASLLSSRADLSAASRLTLSKAQLVLGETNAATASLRHAVTMNTNLVLNPALKPLLRTRVR